jgi:probable rRNA maturation factor
MLMQRCSLESWFAADYGSIRTSMMTLEPPRRPAAKAGKNEQVADVEAWRAWGLSRAGLSRFLRTAQAVVGLVGEVDVLLAGDRTLRRLNREFRGKDKATDVLSFPAPEEFAGEHAGDLAISLDTARKQAVEHGHALRDEVRVLLLHGLLHLSGMDHEIDDGEMAEREGVLRARLRLPDGLIARAGGGSATANARSRFPLGMTERKARATTKAKATARAEADSSAALRNDNQKAKASAKSAKAERGGREGKLRRGGVKA